MLGSSTRDAMKNDPKGGQKVVADNRKARFHYEILDTYEAGLALTGTEVKSLRGGKATIGEAYAGPSGEEFFLFNAYIPEYLQANRFNHETRRPRRLLLQRRQINKLLGATQREGFTVIPLKIYFNERGRAKVELGLGRGKKLHDKREAEKERTWNRERARLMRDKG
jgi:SsrA-binding protein